MDSIGQAPLSSAGASSPGPKSRQARLWAWLRAFDETLHLSYDDIQDRRIAALEREMQRLQAHVQAALGSGVGRPKG